MKGEFEKRFLKSTQPLLEEINWLEGYGDTHETYLSHKSAFDEMVKNTRKIIDEAQKEFPHSTRWKTPSEELKCWRKVSLSGQSRPVASWIKSRIETLEWFIEWFGDENKEVRT